MEILLNTTAYTQSINAERHMKLKQSQGIKKIMIQYLIRLPLACYPILIRLSMLFITRLIALFAILCIKLFTLWENDDDVSFNCVLSDFHVYQMKNIFDQIRVGLWEGMQNTKAPISSYTLGYWGTDLGETTLLLGWRSI